MKPHFYFLASFLGCLSSCQSPVDQQQPIQISWSDAASKPTVFAPSIISNGHQQRDLAISPDGREVFYTLVSPGSKHSTLVHLFKLEDNSWSTPQIPAFSGKYRDLEPAFSPDGRYLYFASNRPLEGNASKDMDIWRVARKQDGYGVAENLGTEINSEGDEFFPSLAANGNLYFTASRADAIGSEDIYVSEWDGQNYSTPVPLDTGVNSPGFEFNAFIAPDESYLIFGGYQRSDGLGGADLYLSLRLDNGRWSQAVNLGPEINSVGLDYCPFVYDGNLFFTSQHSEFERVPDSAYTLEKYLQLLTSPKSGNTSIYRVSWQP